MLALLILAVLCPHTPDATAAEAPASPTAAQFQPQMPAHSNTPTDVTRVWLEMQLVQDLESAAMISDSAFRAKLKQMPTTFLAMLKLIRERPDFQQFSTQLRNRMPEYVTFGPAELLDGGRHARVPLIINEKNFAEWQMQDEVAMQYVQAITSAARSNTTLPTLEGIRSLVRSQAHAANLKRKTEENRQRFRDQPYVEVVMENVGWRVDVTSMEAARKKREEEAKEAKAKLAVEETRRREEKEKADRAAASSATATSAPAPSAPGAPAGGDGASAETNAAGPTTNAPATTK
ncbi:hypothetical protein DB346_19375 [Verrucomicrobia bacterium LW23]|nr:hypothetical protein DB346_19375 [Verrucomicrobia bacterium LW23]